MDNLGIIYSQGLETKSNTTKALEYFEMAAANNSLQALNGLGFMYLNGLGVEKNMTKAFEYIQKAADLGHIES